MNSKDALYSAKKNLEKLLDQVTRYMLVIRGDSTNTMTEAQNELYYSHNYGKSFEKRFSDVISELENIDSDLAAAHVKILNRSMEDVRKAHTLVQEASFVEKKRVEEKRAAVQSKRDLSKELNLQEGVSVKGIDVGQYKILLSGMEPIRQFVFDHTMRNLQARFDRVVSELSKVDFNYDLYLPYVRNQTREQAIAHNEKAGFLSKFFDHKAYGKTMVPKANVSEIMDRISQTTALAYIQGYAVKLSIKIGEVIGHDDEVVSATVSSTTLWEDSVCTVNIRNGSDILAIQFHTQVIWNRSCLGKQFNQYPTRLIK